MSAIIDALLHQARLYANDNDMRAEKAFSAVIENDAFNIEARTFLARNAMQTGQPEKALEHLEIAIRVHSNNPALWRSLGLTHLALTQWPQAQSALEKCLSLAPNMHAARLHLGKALEHQGKNDAATKTYLLALSQAQRDGIWLNAETTPPWLTKDIGHAVNVANKGRHTIYERCMQELYARFESTELMRVDQCLKGVLGFENTLSGNKKQKPTFMYFPGLPESPIIEPSLFPWHEYIESQYASIRTEAEGILSQRSALSPFLELGDNDKISDYLGGQKPNWDAYFFYRHGGKLQPHHDECPITSTTLESLPLVRIEDHAPEICFSVLTPGTHILPHHGVSNVRLVMHLPLIVPENCAINVDGEIHAWKEGECVVFDDTFLHEAWNHGRSTRTILLMDVWNPHLTEVERLAVTHLIEGMGEFNRSAL
jgi:aspartate beta-hydroxylase